MDICLNVPARQQSPALESLDHDPRDFILFHQDRQQWARAALLFPACDIETLAVIRSLENKDETYRPDAEDINTPSLARKKLTQRMFLVTHLKQVLDHSVGRVDHYISQCTFTKPRRHVHGVNQLTACWVDLDTYNDPAANLELRVDADAILSILNVCKNGHENRAFYPTQIVRSGRGLYVKWVFNSFLPGTALPRWKVVQQRLVSVFFKHLCADPKSTDAARVLRVVGSINSKNNEAVRMIYQGDVCSFDALALAVLEQNRMSQIDRDAVKTLTQKYQNDHSNQVKPRAIKWNGDGKTWANLLGQELPKIIEIFGAGNAMRGRMESLAFVVMNYRLMADLVASEANFYEQVEELGQRMGADVELLKSLVKNLWDRRERGETSYRLTKEKIRERLCLDPAQNVAVFQQLPWLLDRPNVVRQVKEVTSKILIDPARVQLLIDSGMQLKQVSNLLLISTKTA